MIHLVRHGETAPNRDRLALGRADPPLTERGRAQAERLASALATTGATHVIVSPLARARETGTRIAGALGVEVEVDARLVELDYGAWDERSFSDFPAEDLARWRADASFAPPGGESLLAVGERIASFCADTIARGDVIVVSHVSPIKAAVLWAMDADPLLAWRMHLDVASISRIDVGIGASRLVGFNSVAHLDGM